MKTILKFLLHTTLFSISLATPKSKRIWLFGAWFGEKYSDNSRYLFEATAQDCNIRKIWISGNEDLLRDLRSRNLECYHCHSLKGLILQLRAKVFFCSINSKDFCFSTISPRNTFIQLWHGLPLKKIGFDTLRPWSLKWIINLIRSKTTDNYRYILSPTDSFDRIFMSAFRLGSSNILRGNYPRCDGLFSETDSAEKIKSLLAITTKNILFYLPTHRNEGRSPEKIQNLINQIKTLKPLLESTDSTLIIKPHFYESENFHEECSENLIVTKDLPADLYYCLSGATGIITDYSSIAFDFATTGKPIFFFTPDLDDYVKNDRETYFNLTDLIPESAATVEELSTQISRKFSNTTDNTNKYFDIEPRSTGGFSKELQQRLEGILK